MHAGILWVGRRPIVATVSSGSVAAAHGPGHSARGRGRRLRHPCRAVAARRPRSSAPSKPSGPSSANSCARVALGAAELTVAGIVSRRRRCPSPARPARIRRGRGSRGRRPPALRRGGHRPVRRNLDVVDVSTDVPMQVPLGKVHHRRKHRVGSDLDELSPEQTAGKSRRAEQVHVGGVLARVGEFRRGPPAFPDRRRTAPRAAARRQQRSQRARGRHRADDEAAVAQIGDRRHVSPDVCSAIAAAIASGGRRHGRPRREPHLAARARGRSAGRRTSPSSGACCLRQPSGGRGLHRPPPGRRPTRSCRPSSRRPSSRPSSARAR